MITIVDFGMGNLGSILNMFRKLGINAEVTADQQSVARAEKLILPGVGAFDAGMESLVRSGLLQVLEERVLRGRVPTLGICLGMQLMTRRSAEGVRPGLGWIDAEVLRFQPPEPTVKVPHMGWNVVQIARTAPLVEDLAQNARFYFVHSYYVRCNVVEDVLLTTPYAGVFHSGFHRENVWGVQFHPEKSHRFGMQLLRNFAERC